MTMKRPAILVISVSLTLAPLAGALAERETENWLYLQRLNQSTFQQLHRQQQRDSALPTAPLTPSARERLRLNAQQRNQLQRLQESQRRQQIVNGQRQRLMPSWSSQSTRLQQQMQRLQYRQAQQRLLQRRVIEP